MNEPTTTLIGNLTSDPELRFTTTGTAVANFTVAVTPRRFDAKSGGYVDGEPVFLRCTAWRTLAENTAESFRRGDRVIVTGQLRTNSFETHEGDKRSSTELTATEVGASVQFAQVRIVKPERHGAGADTAAAAAGHDVEEQQPPF
ncbi:MAG: single-stranded DNA-binding protein [Micromonosporaceae bacterium]